MMKKNLFLSLLLISVAASGVPIVRVVGTHGLDKAFATDNVHKLVLSPTSVNVENNEGSVLLRVPLAEIAHVEFTDGMPDSSTSVETILMKDKGIVKIIEHNQVYIIRSGRKYNVMGMEVEQK